jgi:BlaI family transcriptional regulator, penicillinase repressor
MKRADVNRLSRRERQIMDVIYQRKQATAAEVKENIPDAPGYSAIRALLAILVNKGYLKVEEDGPRYVYRPKRARSEAGRSAIRHVLETFFDGSVEQAVAALLEPKEAQLSRTEIDRLQSLIDQARRGERKP